MINIFNEGTKIVLIVIGGIVCLIVYCCITKNRGDRKYRVKWAAIIACIYTLMTFVFNNLLHYYEYRLVYGFENVRFASLLKSDISYSVGLGEFRYPGLLIVTFALCLIITYLNNKINSYIEGLFEDEEAIARELARQQFLSNSTIIGIGGFGAKILNIFRQIQPDISCLLIYEEDTKNIGLSSINHIKIGAEGISTDNAVELIKSIKPGEQVFIVSDFSSLTGCRLTKEVSKIAYNLDIFSEVVVTIPFSFEGQETVKRAGAAINEILQSRVCNSLFIANKDGIIDHCPCEMTSEHAFTHLYDIIYDHIFNGYRMRTEFAMDKEDYN